MLLVLALQALPLDELRSNDIGVRMSAEERLKSFPPSALREALATERDPEARARLRTALRWRCFEKSESAYREGRLLDSLRALLEAEEVKEVEAELARRLARLRERFFQLTAPSNACEKGDARLTAVQDWVKREGRWSYPILLEGLAPTSSQWTAFHVLKFMGTEVHPLVRGTLRSGATRQIKFTLMEILWTRRDWTELESVRDDESLDPWIRDEARVFLENR